ncbi:MAG: VWA domain-containing protein [Acidobacteriota bacterium]|nr:VWA domain-containing protein [Acidobacteriota bacterium]
MYRTFTAALILILTLTLVPAAMAQEEQPGVFGEIIDVRVVNVEVVVTDRDGLRVPDLKAEDFQLIVDGQETPVQYFSEVRGGQAVATPGQAPAAPAVAQAGEGQAVGTSYLVFIDDFFPLKRDRDRVLRALADELGALGPADRMAVVAYDGKELDMLTSWSSSIAELERAFQQARRRDAHGIQRIIELRNLDADAREFAGRPYEQRDFDSGVTFLTPPERDYSNRLENQLENAVLAATATLRSFAAPPGRKVMILLAGGWPLEPELYAVNSREAPLQDVSDPLGGRRLYADLSDTANLLGYTLYPVDIPGVQVDSLDAEDSVPPDLEANLEAQRAVPTQDLDPTQSTLLTGTLTNRGLREFGVHGSLRFLATETGGKPLLNSLREAPFAEVVADTRSYYWLGFSPQRQEDDERHDIKVKVLRPGLQVRARDSFLDFSRTREVSMMVESTLLFGNSPSNESLEVDLGQRQGGFGRTMEVPLSITIPMDSITMIPVGEQYGAQLELRVAALDKSGQRSEVPVVPVVLRGDQPPPEGSHAVYETSVRLRKGTTQMVVSLYDPASGGILATTVDLDRRR